MIISNKGPHISKRFSSSVEFLCLVSNFCNHWNEQDNYLPDTDMCHIMYWLYSYCPILNHVIRITEYLIFTIVYTIVWRHVNVQTVFKIYYSKWRQDFFTIHLVIRGDEIALKGWCFGKKREFYPKFMKFNETIARQLNVNSVKCLETYLFELKPRLLNF